MTVRTVQDLETLRDRPRRLLAVFPHPDDEAYGSAGALARAGRDPDGAAVLLCLTRGEASSHGRRQGLAPEEVGRRREQRLVAVAGTVSLAGLVVPGLPDGRVARLPLEETATVVREVLDAFRPQVVITHDPRGVNGHADHIATHWAVRRATEGTDVRVAMVVYTQATSDAVRPRLIFPTPEAEIDVVLRLSPEETAAKERCLRIHEALVTLVPERAGDLLLRPAEERYDLLGEDLDPPADDLFVGRRSVP